MRVSAQNRTNTTDCIVAETQQKPCQNATMVLRFRLTTTMMPTCIIVVSKRKSALNHQSYHRTSVVYQTSSLHRSEEIRMEGITCLVTSDDGASVGSSSGGGLQVRPDGLLVGPFSPLVRNLLGTIYRADSARGS